MVSHDWQDNANSRCRLCRLQAALAQVQATLRPRQGRGPLKTALGLAVPSVEAWYLVGREQWTSEATWKHGLESGKLPYTKPWLKEQVYGTDRPSIELETRRAIEETRRIVKKEKLKDLEDRFPGGFGTLAKEIRNWRDR